ncbi:MAG: glycosyltransferase [Deltaproteobacteria bacterium]|nr:glycosyltransferase [Deltaproteobacteria bacterium]NIS78272.1 glycosyltransferase [Deltaproteobacteria bacterium]
MAKHKIRDQCEYIARDEFFNGWKQAFEYHGHRVLIDGRNSYLLPPKLAYSFPRLYRFFHRLLKKTGIIPFDEYLLSKSIGKKARSNNVDLIFTEINDFLDGKVVKKYLNQGLLTQWFGVYPDMVSEKVRKRLADYDMVWCPVEYEEMLKEGGVNFSRFFYLGASFDEKMLYHQPDLNYSHDVSFVGGITGHHKGRIEILEKVAENYESFAFWGYGIEYVKKNSILRERFKGRAEIDDMRKIYSSSKISINIPLDNYERVSKGFNARLFEIPPCRGALQMVQHNENVADFFVPGEEVICFHGVDDLVEKIRYYLQNEDERRKVVENAFNKSFDFTYKNRAEKLLEIATGKYR